jgi:hypothetical protein
MKSAVSTVIVAALLVAASSAMLAPTHAYAQVNLNIIIGNPPPPPRYEVVPRPRPGYVWAPGYWNWNGRDHDWRGGHWERAREGQVYYRPQWVQADNGWRFQEGGWRGEQRARQERYQRDEYRREEYRHDEHRREEHRREEHRDDGEGRGHGHGGGFCPPGQAKKGNC